MADLYSCHYISVDSIVPEWKKGLNLPLFGFPEQLPAYLIMYNQKSGHRHTGDFGVRSSHPQDFCLFFFWSLLGFGEKCKFTIYYACLAFKRQSRLNCFWDPAALTLWLVETAFTEGKFPIGLQEKLWVVQFSVSWFLEHWVLIRVHTCGYYLAPLYKMLVPFRPLGAAP